MPPKPLILAFDTSAAHCAAALLCGDEILSERLEPMQKGQAERLFPLLEEVLSEHGKAWPDLDAIGVCIGPGNFTGVRISVSSARGLALSLGISAVGVSKLEAMTFGTRGSAVAFLDARRGRVYSQIFEDGDAQTEPEMVELSDAPNGIPYVMADETLQVKDAVVLSNIVTSVAKITALRYTHDSPRPAPLYLRSADAALPSDPPVTILP
ncbi:tRNA (adenosine(37)-N6)-threonylcarbamoyltransferase complex dimerization subunit type 1 TsaB [Amylibacter sp. SFDW26]|uniref:tRNA (adenosine(37)-N6)-threonylcarbamoyltransferase complex dimerization subunit type 1 TsaB n=1 Tax=Amylibacter sp. SFDW26 TaxID=2652722 RepID=UPI001262395E|nr:tRNA (adenosine(37)-N6)-threonylcarbamoyltransferase complex dimerization subunit type 1 TsaB [Amylibacter sp. SFDW26]KAB7615276.1 tRNA (adenosine(37)-N6)-threonylcarbamoyltransferase complex dimerization subunit type 1 TsaB [Amylibacter sp. SFDW26]